MFLHSDRSSTRWRSAQRFIYFAGFLNPLNHCQTLHKEKEKQMLFNASTEQSDLFSSLTFLQCKFLFDFINVLFCDNGHRLPWLARWRTSERGRNHTLPDSVAQQNLNAFSRCLRCHFSFDVDFPIKYINFLHAPRTLSLSSSPPADQDVVSCVRPAVSGC